jgi:hypothetical protein
MTDWLASISYSGVPGKPLPEKTASSKSFVLNAAHKQQVQESTPYTHPHAAQLGKVGTLRAGKT